jgi:hypothetical protein
VRGALYVFLREPHYNGHKNLSVSFFSGKLKNLSGHPNKKHLLSLNARKSSSGANCVTDAEILLAFNLLINDDIFYSSISLF